jgi:hypothetical protein
MSTYLACDGYIDTTMLTCSTGWYTAQPVDFHDLVALLQFDPEICAYITGCATLFFIVGHASGHVARQLSRH